MSVVYSIRDWEKHFECSQSKRADKLSWVATPNKHDGKSFRRLIQMKNGTALYGAWILIVQVASKCPVRGILADSDGPLNAEDIADKTLTDPKLIQATLDACCSKAIGWIVKDETRSECDTPESISIDGGVPTGQDITEHNNTEHNSAPIPAVAVAWNQIPGVTHVRSMTPSRSKSLSARLADSEWQRCWPDAIDRVSQSSFCKGGGSTGWKADLDWFLKPDTVTKILEGKYDDRAAPSAGSKMTGIQQFLEDHNDRD